MLRCCMQLTAILALFICKSHTQPKLALFSWRMLSCHESAIHQQALLLHQ